MVQDFVLRAIKWAFHLLKRSVRSTAFAKVLAGGDAIDNGKLLAQIYSLLLGMDFRLLIVVDSKNLSASISTSGTHEDKTIRADIELLFNHFDTHSPNKLV